MWRKRGLVCDGEDCRVEVSGEGMKRGLGEGIYGSEQEKKGAE